VVAASSPVYRAHALEAGLPAVYLTLAGTEADAERIAEAIRQRVVARAG
jgi:hypothetical protein